MRSQVCFQKVRTIGLKGERIFVCRKLILFSERIMYSSYDDDDDDWCYCASCNRDVHRHGYSTRQWQVKPPGVRRCIKCIHGGSPSPNSYGSDSYGNESDAEDNCRCACCLRDLPMESYSRNQWESKPVGIRRCVDCIQGSSKRRQDPEYNDDQRGTATTTTTAKRSRDDPVPSPLGKHYTLFFDGACSPNPGKGGCGYVLCDGSDTFKGRQQLGECTSNIAEYLGLIHGLHYLHSKEPDPEKVSSLIVCGDSELVIRQLIGEYKVVNPRLLLYYQLARALLKKFGKVMVGHVSREDNYADALAKDAVQEHSRQQHLDDGIRLSFYPHLCKALATKVLDKPLRATIQAPTARLPRSMIDAEFLYRINPSYFKEIRPTEAKLVVNKGPMLNVLGKLDVDLVVYSPIGVVIQKPFVVENLPVPVHLKSNPILLGAIPDVSSIDDVDFGQDYASRPYWHSDTLFLPYAF